MIQKLTLRFLKFGYELQARCKGRGVKAGAVANAIATELL